MNETEHIDLRIIKTKESIKKAFQNLIEKKSFSHKNYRLCMRVWTKFNYGEKNISILPS